MGKFWLAAMAAVIASASTADAQIWRNELWPAAATRGAETPAQPLCAIVTRIGEDAVFRLAVRDGASPVIRVTETVETARPPRMRDGEVVHFTFDDGERFPVQVEAMALGDAWAVDAMVGALSTAAVLRSLRRSTLFTIMREDEVLHQAPLAGFEAAFIALSAHCGPQEAGLRPHSPLRLNSIGEGF